MGTDCRVIAEMKDGSYKTMYLDRLYKFTMDLDNDKVNTDYKQNKKYSFKEFYHWWARRRKVINKKDAAWFGEGATDKKTMLAAMEDIYKFMTNIANNLSEYENIQWIGIFDEHSKVYELVIFETDKSKVIEIQII